MKAFFEDRHFREVVKGASGAFIYKFLGMVAGYAFTFVVGRYLGAGSLGVFTLFLSVLSIAGMIGKYGFDASIARYVANLMQQRNTESIRKIYKKSMRFSLLLTLAISVIMMVCARWMAEEVFHVSELTWYYRILPAGLFAFVIVAINGGFLRGLKKAAQHSFFQNFARFLFPMLYIFPLIYLVSAVGAPIYAYVLGLLTAATISTRMVLRHLRYQKSELPGTAKTEDPPFREVVGVSSALLLTTSFTFLLWWTDSIMLGIFKTETDVGVYNAALKISNIVSITLVAVTSITGPKFSEMFYSNDRLQLKRFMWKVSGLSFFTSLPAAIIIFLVPGYLLGWVGDDFVHGTTPLIILTINQLVHALAGVNGLLLEMTNQEKVARNILFVSVVLNVVLNYIWIPEYGITGAALATTVSMSSRNVISVLYVNQFFLRSDRR
ncbi:MAG: flippase [Flavobacteriales bacterium]|nr:flippase [Flavobacteriales bacterium]